MFFNRMHLVLKQHLPIQCTYKHRFWTDHGK